MKKVKSIKLKENRVNIYADNLTKKNRKRVHNNNENNITNTQEKTYL